MSAPEQSISPILLAEDEETDVMMFRLALEKTKLGHPLHVVRDGKEAIDYMMGVPPYADREAHPVPGLVVLDIKMPRMTGLDVLSWLKSHQDFGRIPAVVLSSSSYPPGIEQATQRGAREYFIKPHSISELAAILRTAIARWLGPVPNAEA